jgi:hypothetical protein
MGTPTLVRPDVDGRLVSATLEAIREAEKLAAQHDDRARFGSNADLESELAMAADRRAEQGRQIVKAMLAVLLPGVDQAELARAIG